MGLSSALGISYFVPQGQSFFAKFACSVKDGWNWPRPLCASSLTSCSSRSIKRKGKNKLGQYPSI